MKGVGKAKAKEMKILTNLTDLSWIGNLISCGN